MNLSEETEHFADRMQREQIRVGPFTAGGSVGTFAAILLRQFDGIREALQEIAWPGERVWPVAARERMAGAPQVFVLFRAVPDDAPMDRRHTRNVSIVWSAKPQQPGTVRLMRRIFTQGDEVLVEWSEGPKPEYLEET